MARSNRPRRAASVAALACTLAAACVVGPVDYTGKRCPCRAPWECGDDGLCRLAGDGGGPDGDADLDADADGDADAGPGDVAGLAAGLAHTCALLGSGAVRCWGDGALGALGYGSTESIGDDETPASAGDVDVGGPVRIGGLSARGHTCAVLDGGGLRCWGDGAQGQLGHASIEPVGDDETPASAGDVAVGGEVAQVAAGASHTCAVLEGGAVRCWGDGRAGQLGYGATASIGDDETPETAGDVDVGGLVVEVAAGRLHTCARLDTGAVRCWGSGADGRLGSRSTRSVGDDETPASAGDVDLGGRATQLAAGWDHTCALLESGAVRCWGLGLDGRLGYGNERSVGDNETPASAGDVNVGGAVRQITAGLDHTCALLDSGSVRCWGAADHGQLGYGNTNAVGDDEAPADMGYVDVGGRATWLAAGAAFTCALLESGAVRCWGDAAAIGLGGAEDVGDDEPPASADPVPIR